MGIFGGKSLCKRDTNATLPLELFSDKQEISKRYLIKILLPSSLHGAGSFQPPSLRSRSSGYRASLRNTVDSEFLLRALATHSLGYRRPKGHHAPERNGTRRKPRRSTLAGGFVGDARPVGATGVCVEGGRGTKGGSVAKTVKRSVEFSIRRGRKKKINATPPGDLRRRQRHDCQKNIPRGKVHSLLLVRNPSPIFLFFRCFLAASVFTPSFTRLLLSFSRPTSRPLVSPLHLSLCFRPEPLVRLTFASSIELRLFDLRHLFCHTRCVPPFPLPARPVSYYSSVSFISPIHARSAVSLPFIPLCPRRRLVSTPDSSSPPRTVSGAEKCIRVQVQLPRGQPSETIPRRAEREKGRGSVLRATDEAARGFKAIAGRDNCNP